MSDMRVIGRALELYVMDHRSYPYAANINDLLRIFKDKQMARSGSLKGKDYSRDVWGNSYRYLAWPLEQPTHYRLASAGRDGIWELKDPSGYQQGIIRSFDNDIVLGDATFIRFPDRTE